MLSLLLALCLTADDAPAPKVGPVDAPKGTPPRIVTGNIKGGVLITQETVCEYRAVKVRKKVIVGGKETEVETVMYERVQVIKEVKQDLKKATITTAGGKKLTAANAEKHLARPTGLLLSGDGNPVDAGYLAMFKGDTVVIVLPLTSAPADPAVPQPLPPDKD